METNSYQINLYHIRSVYYRDDNVALVDKQEVSLVYENVFEVKNYPTTAFVFELAPETDVGSLAR